MDRNAVTATLLVILILLGYQWYLSRHTVPAPAPRPSVAQSPAPPPSVRAPAGLAVSGPGAAATGPRRSRATDEASAPTRDIIVDTPLVHVVFSTAGARATVWQLKKYRLPSGDPVDLAAGTVSRPGVLSAWADPEQIGGPYQVDVTRLDLTQGARDGSVTFRQVDPRGLAVEKRLTFHADRYPVDVTVRTQNLTDGPTTLQIWLAWGPGLWGGQERTRATLSPPTFLLDGKLQQDKGDLAGERILPGTVGWAALEDAYFAAALVPRDPGLQAFTEKGAPPLPSVGLVTPVETVPAGQDAVLQAQLFAGPRDIDVLKAAGNHLDWMVDLGWFAFLARPALWLLKRLDGFTGNYGVAIILVTLLVRVALYPVTARSLTSMRKMQALQPELKAVQERHKNDPQKKQEEMMALYRRHGVNPMGGCLPMLVQIPIFVALYRALSGSVAMWQAPFLWIRDLTRPDAVFTTTLWGGHLFSLNLLALLMGVSMWLQQRVSPAAGDPQQARIMLWAMPVVFTAMFWSFPAGLVLYWLVSNLVQTGQQWLISRRTPHRQPA